MVTNDIVTINVFIAGVLDWRAVSQAPDSGVGISLARLVPECGVMIRGEAGVRNLAIKH